MYIKSRIERIYREITELKKILILEGVIDKEKSEVAWRNLLILSKEISARWEGFSAVEEIRNQREK
ncbi:MULTISPECIES: hypothetical protein [Dictyoglomus]|jgi:hypothetical protein|uniref:Uncharacterized protein n=1 Tax=Dictyoglomus turgidum (strain DSM 6724 / Z-1310) TaxID=515635 RepID=B8DZF1_DICTD|nr:MULTISPECIES: hypothetical protein [Dictyoglomus]ACK41884.1 hypothetical protein Dtur_0596 [Dictyoglomus turgidum DSM 6724]PNV78928.1 MAG: hypothetical protein C0196_07595 [Dictyoglomus turgidum]HBU31262.1 hypothetical protein [Dictyoglomus sp.]